MFLGSVHIVPVSGLLRDRQDSLFGAQLFVATLSRFPLSAACQPINF